MMAQLAPAASDAGQLLDCAKDPVLIATLLMLNGLEPLLVRVMVCGADVVLIN